MRSFALNLLCFCAVVPSVLVKLGRSRESLSTGPHRTTRQVQLKGCKLPQHPAFGNWSIYEETTIYQPGQVVPHRTTLQVTCQEKYALDGNEIVLCKNGVWSAVIGKCLQTCPSRYSTSTMNITCTKNGIRLETCQNVIEGTIANFKCAPFYEDPALDIHPIHLCFNGAWNHKLPECTPICGQKSPMADPTLINKGHNVTKGEYPWQVALYDSRTKEQLCGGSLLSQRVVLTAAHCITSLDGTILPKELYLVAVGKYFRKFDHPEDRDVAQFSEILEMHPHSDYFGEEDNYFADIAVLVTKSTFTLTLRVQPVCVDYGLRRFATSLSPTKIGDAYIIGWGFTEHNKNPSSVLKELKVPIIERRECKEMVPDDFRRYVMNDKVCAGYYNIGASVCKGDSGGGLVVRNRDRFYIIGIVSLAPQAQKGGCDNNQYGVYTKVQKYVDFIYEKVESFRVDPENCEGSQCRVYTKQVETIPKWNCEDDPSCKSDSLTANVTTTATPTTEKPIDSCVLPEHPVSGQWSVYGVTAPISPGMAVASRTIVLVSCADNHQLTESSVVVCFRGNWISSFGKCLRTCPPLVNSETVSYTCSSNDKQMKDCSSPVEGTIAKRKCAPFFEDLARNPAHICRNGTWSESTSECVPVCGQKPVDSTSLFFPKVEFPWQIAIYDRHDRNYFCGGVLISQRLILAAAHCFRKPDKRIKPKLKYIVATGKLFRNFANSPDNDNAQFFELRQVFILPNYKPADSGNYIGDIAVLVTRKSFTFSRQVLPVCLDWGHRFDNNTDVVGEVIGWGENLSEPSKSLNLTIIPDQVCYTGKLNETEANVRSDKFCVDHQSRSVGVGDSRAPFLVQQGGRYFVTGVFSSHVNNESGSNRIGLYTKVSRYVERIAELDAKLIAILCSTDNDCENKTLESEVQRSCSLPPQPEFGNFSIIFSPPRSNSSNSSLASGTVLLLTCHEPYKLNGNEQIFCNNGDWLLSIGNCQKTSHSVHNTTISTLMCGKLDPDKNSNSDYPWQVGVYKGSENRFSCNGVLISEKVVLTVAQCLTKVWNVLPSKDQFSVVAGKHRNPTESSHVQTSKLSEIFIHPQFKKVGRGFINNIAVLVTSQPFILSKFLQPVCVDWNLSYYKSLKSTALTGYVFKHFQAQDWFFPDQYQNFATVSPLSGEFQNLQVQIVDGRKCRETFPARLVDSHKDKFCSNYEGTRKSVCGGVNGDGIVVKFQDRFYLAGILETPESTSFSSCDVQDYEIFTNISAYLDDFISQKMKKTNKF